MLLLQMIIQSKIRLTVNDFKSYKKIANRFAPIIGGIIVRESINAKKLIKKNHKTIQENCLNFECLT